MAPACGLQETVDFPSMTYLAELNKLRRVDGMAKLVRDIVQTFLAPEATSKPLVPLNCKLQVP
jgi:hypothetical protein